MTHKVRKHVYSEARHEKMLNRLPKELDLPEPELIRQGLEMVLARGEGPVSHPQAWVEERAFIR
ncbi:MAG TPA: hypothetical protein DCP08_02795 [Chloroflexi bacterium]|nr:hypothetical protein [Chloroflexota bacterium]